MQHMYPLEYPLSIVCEPVFAKDKGGWELSVEKPPENVVADDTPCPEDSVSADLSKSRAPVQR